MLKKNIVNGTINFHSSIVYVNFAPYENAGKILDYLIENFELVSLFSFNFHRLGKKRDQNKLIVYRNGNVINSKDLFDFKVPEKLIFFLLPIRSTLIFFQLLFYNTYLHFKYGKANYFFSVNAFTSWVGNVLKSFGFVDKTIFWVWDYYPPKHPRKIIIFMRWLYWRFDKMATKSDILVFLNKRVANLHRSMGILQKTTVYKIIPIGTSPSFSKRNINKAKLKRLNIAFVGVIKKSQGLDIIFNNSKLYNKLSFKIKLDIIGAGPEFAYYKELANKTEYECHFHGYISDKQIDRILKKSHVGIAPYVPSKNNVAYFGDPSKIKQYLSSGLPVITTNVFEFSKEIKAHTAGIIINYNAQDLLKALRKITKSYPKYSGGAYNLAKKYSYKKIYSTFFD